MLIETGQHLPFSGITDCTGGITHVRAASVQIMAIRTDELKTLLPQTAQCKVCRITVEEKARVYLDEYMPVLYALEERVVPQHTHIAVNMGNHRDTVQ